MFVYMAQPATWPVQRFRATLERILDETGLPQAGLAALVPMDQSQLSRWKSGTSRPKFESLKVLGEALRASYPSLAIGPNELLDSAGYAPPEPAAPVIDAHPGAREPTSPGVRVEQRDGSHVTYAVTVESGLTMLQAIDSLRPLTEIEDVLIGNLRLMGFGPIEVQGAVLFLREQAEEQADPGTGGLRRKA